MSTRRLLHLVGVATFATLTLSAARADVTQTVNATTNATVKPAGPRTGVNGVKFFNVEGSANGTNASYGVIRFDTAPIKAAFDTQLGANSYAINDIRLNLIEANAAFTHAGDISFAFTPDNSTDISALNTALKYDATSTPSSAQWPQTLIANGSFDTTGAVNNGKVDTYLLLAGNAGSDLLRNAIMNGSIVTLLVNDDDPTVAATWTGATNTTPPFLSVTAGSAASIPEPGTLVLLLGGAPGLLALRRRAR